MNANCEASQEITKSRILDIAIKAATEASMQITEELADTFAVDLETLRYTLAKSIVEKTKEKANER